MLYVYLETSRLLLRRFTPDDADLLLALDSDPAVMRYITGGVATTRQEIETDHLPAFLDYYQRGDRWGFWAAIEKAGGTFLGWFHLRPHGQDADDEPELGYRLRSSAWGAGYATEGARALVHKAFAELGASRVHAETMAVHVASRRVMEKSGLRFARSFVADWPVRIDGDEHGDVEYALTRAEWEAAAREGRYATWATRCAPSMSAVGTPRVESAMQRRPAGNRPSISIHQPHQEEL